VIEHQDYEATLFDIRRHQKGLWHRDLKLIRFLGILAIDV